MFLALTVCVGIVLRFALHFAGHNYDFESYRIVAEIVGRGGNVYAETHRYNYGPIWFSVLGALEWLAVELHEPRLFRAGIVGILTVADLAIAFLLYRRYGAAAAALFFLNPVSIIITGYHNQFDNLAIALGLYALMVIDRRFVLGLCLVGASLVVKHIFFMLPLWLAIRATTWRERSLAIGLPLIIFGASFLPFVSEGKEGIIANVFLYKSFNNGLLYVLLLTLWPPIKPVFVFIVVLATLGWLVRRQPTLEAGLIYLIAVVAFSPAVANQYLAIPMAAVAAWPNVWFTLYTVIATFILLISADGLYLDALTARLGPIGAALMGRQGYWLPVTILIVGLHRRLAGDRRPLITHATAIAAESPSSGRR